MKKKINDSKKSKYIFVTLCIGCCALVILSLASDMSVGPLKYVSGYVITPIQKGLNEVGNWISDKGVYLQSNVDYAAQCKELQEKVDQLTAENTELLADREVIARDSDNWFNVFTIDKGSDDGIEVNNNVISNGGLVGIVTDVGPNYAIVRSIIDDYSNVSAMVTTTEDTCIIAGDLRLIDEGKINLVKLTDSRDKVTVGDKVVTSDISSRFLPGILIGYISEISMDSNNLTKSGYITPAVDFRHLREVIVIRDQKEVAGADESLKQAASKETEGLVNDSTEAATAAETETADTAASDNGQ